MVQQIRKLYNKHKKRFFHKIVGTAAKPRLSVFRSNNHIYAQLIDDVTRKTLVCSSTVERKIKDVLHTYANKKASQFVGQILAQKAKANNIKFAVFDRGNKPYRGRIKSLAEGARVGGLVF